MVGDWIYMQEKGGTPMEDAGEDDQEEFVFKMNDTGHIQSSQAQPAFQMQQKAGFSNPNARFYGAKKRKTRKVVGTAQAKRPKLDDSVGTPLKSEQALTPDSRVQTQGSSEKKVAQTPAFEQPHPFETGYGRAYDGDS